MRSRPKSASDGTGFGSSSPCLPFADCPNGTGWVQRVVRGMRDSGKTVTVLNLAVPGSVVGPEIENLARQLGRGSIGNFVERQLPFVSRNSTLVTIFVCPLSLRTSWRLSASSKQTTPSLRAAASNFPSGLKARART